MTDAPPAPHVLVLNSGLSSLKFGLYRVGSSQVDTLTSGEAEAIGQGESRFHAQDARRNVLLSKNISMPDRRDAIVRIAALLVGSTMPAPLAIRFCYSIRKQIAAMIAALDGVDVIIFTGGVGENDPGVRAEICSGLRWIGILLDEARNRGQTNPISDPRSRCAILVLASQEDEQIVRHTGALFANLLTRFDGQKRRTGR